MKGFVALIVAIAVGGIGWGYTPASIREKVAAVVKKNIFPIVAAIVVVSTALILSMNTTLRFI